MRVERLNRVELLLPADQIDAAVKTYAELLAIPIAPPELLDEGQVLTTTCWEAGVEFIAPGGPASPLNGLLAQQPDGGAVGPIVWEVRSLGPIRDYARSCGIEVIYEMDTGHGGRQLSLSPADCFGYIATFIENPPKPALPPGARIRRFNRIELLLPAEDLEPARAFFGRLLEADIKPFEYIPQHHVLTRTCWEAGFELFGPGDETSVLHPMLARKGRRGVIGPVVWEVEDLDEIKRAAVALGHQPVYEFAYEDRRQLCLSAETLFGYTATFTQLLK